MWQTVCGLVWNSIITSIQRREEDLYAHRKLILIMKLRGTLSHSSVELTTGISHGRKARKDADSSGKPRGPTRHCDSGNVRSLLLGLLWDSLRVRSTVTAVGLTPSWCNIVGDVIAVIHLTNCTGKDIFHFFFCLMHPAGKLECWKWAFLTKKRDLLDGFADRYSIHSKIV